MARRKPSTELRSRYRKIRLPDGTTIDEHRYIMEQRLGRRLTRREVVHHKNDDPKDNRPENLELMSLSAHSRMHSTERQWQPKPICGEDSNFAKLTNAQVLQIMGPLVDGRDSPLYCSPLRSQLQNRRRHSPS